MDFSTIFYWELCWACGLVFDKQLPWTFQVFYFHLQISLFMIHVVAELSSLPGVSTYVVFLSSCVHLWLWRWWRPLQLYAGFNIVILYVYQLPMEFPSMLQRVADFIGLFKITANSEWPEICSSFSLILFYIMVCILNLPTGCHFILYNFCSSIWIELLFSS